MLRKSWFKKKQPNPVDIDVEDGQSGYREFNAATPLKRDSRLSRRPDDQSQEDRGGPCSLPLLQIWPSEDSETPTTEDMPSTSAFSMHQDDHQNDSGIESIQASPSPSASPRQSVENVKRKRTNSYFLHPDDAKKNIFRPRSVSVQMPTHEESLITELKRELHPAQSISSVAENEHPAINYRLSDPFDRRRCSALSYGRYSILDALDLENAFLRASTRSRSSATPSSIALSLQRLTFTQSLAFPALARGLSKQKGRRRSSEIVRPQPSLLSGLAKFITSIILVVLSIMVFALVWSATRD